MLSRVAIAFRIARCGRQYHAERVLANGNCYAPIAESGEHVSPTVIEKVDPERTCALCCSKSIEPLPTQLCACCKTTQLRVCAPCTDMPRLTVRCRQCRRLFTY